MPKQRQTYYQSTYPKILCSKTTSAQNEIRTRTSLRMPPPQDGASTNFATRAFLKYKVGGLKSFIPTSDFRLKTNNLERMCPKRDSNSQETILNGFWDRNVYQFRHSGRAANIILSFIKQLNNHKKTISFNRPRNTAILKCFILHPVYYLNTLSPKFNQ